MRRIGILVGIAWLLAGWTWGELSVTAFAQTPDATAPELPEEYVQATESFMAGEGENMTRLVAAAMRNGRTLSRDQRSLLIRMRREAMNFDPKWWPNVRSTSNVSFKAEMWRKRFAANYMPSEQLGMQAPIDIDPVTDRLKVIVTWRPNLVDNPKPLKGWLAQKHGITQANLAEVIVWHELGHNYITLHLPVAQALELYQNHGMLFSHVQEFYADLTALRHCEPKAARTTLMFRLTEMYGHRDNEPHTRAAHGLAALMLVEWMENPDKWPMVHFPPKVPEKNVELETIKYVYENFDVKWSVEEYMALHDFIDGWVGRHGDRVLRGKGQIRLPNDLEMKLMVSDDREFQPKRDQWVAKKLEELIESGRADKKPGNPEKPKVTQIGDHVMWTGIEIPW